MEEHPASTPIPLKTYPPHYLATLSLERSVERQQRGLAKTLRRIRTVDSSLASTYQKHVSPNQPRISLTPCDGVDNLDAVMEQVNRMPESMPPGLGMAQSIGVNWKRAKHWALTRQAKKQDQRLKEMRERLDRVKPETPFGEPVMQDQGAFTVGGVPEYELGRLARDARRRTDRQRSSHGANNAFGALIAAQRAYGTPAHQAEPFTEHSYPRETAIFDNSSRQFFSPGQALSRALHDLSGAPVDPGPVLVEFKPDSETVALVFAAMRLAAFLMLRLLIWTCIGVREAAQWCEVNIAPPTHALDRLLLQNGDAEDPIRPAQDSQAQPTGSVLI